MAAFAGAGPRGDTGRRGSSILAAGGWSNCCLRHASAEDWTALTALKAHQMLSPGISNKRSRTSSTVLVIAVVARAVVLSAPVTTAVVPARTYARAQRGAAAAALASSSVFP